MFNVNQITATLAKLPDQALQQYAQLHKEDPYILSLAVSESNRRKALRAAPAQMGEGATAEQPPVSEQAVADMGLAGIAPESAGEFAAGGLVAFSGGGTTPYAPYGPNVKDWRAQVQAGAEYDPLQLQEAWKKFKGMFTDPRLSWNIPQVSDRYRTEGRNYAASADTDAAVMNDEARKRAAAKAAPAAGLAATEAAQRAPGAAAGVGGQGTAAPRSMDLQALQRRLFDPDAALSEAEKRNDAVTQAEREMAEGDLQAFRDAAKARGVAGADREKRIQGDLEGLGGKREEAKANAFLQAGLAILAADPSKGGWAAIGSGALQGLGAFKGDVKELAATRDKLQDDIDRIHELRRQESMADDKEARGLQSLIRRTEVDGKKRTAEMYNKFGLEIAPRMAGDLFKAMVDVQQDDKKIAAQRAATNAARTPAEIQLVERMMRDPQFAATYRSLQSAKYDPRAEAALRKQYNDSFLLQSQFPSFEAFAAAQGLQSGNAGPSAPSGLSPADQALVNKYR